MDPDPPLRERPRLPGTYASDHARDPSPRVGRAVLIALIVLDELSVLIELYQYLAVGEMEALLTLATRQVVLVSLYFTFWMGWSWCRWLTAVSNCLIGLWFVIWSLHLQTGGNVAVGMPLLIGVFSLAVAAFFAISPDLTAFIEQNRQRRSARRLWPMALLLAGYLAVLAIAWSALAYWRKGVEQKALAFARGSILEVGAQWDVSALDRLSSPDLLASESLATRQERLERIRDHCGAVRSVDPAPLLDQVTIRGGVFRHAMARGVFGFSVEGESGRFIMTIGVDGNLAGEGWKISSYVVRLDVAAPDANASGAVD